MLGTKDPTLPQWTTCSSPAGEGYPKPVDDIDSRDVLELAEWPLEPRKPTVTGWTKRRQRYRFPADALATYEHEMTAWLKTFHMGDPRSPRKLPSDRTATDGDFTFYEPLRRTPDGSPKLTGKGEPEGRPSWRRGDLVGGYWNGSYRVGEVWEVAGGPELCELDDWAWQTPVKPRTVRASRE